jgi:hypothetical protein
LGRGLLDVLDIASDLGRQDILLLLEPVPSNETTNRSAAVAGDLEWSQPVEATIDMRLSSQTDPRLRTARNYTIHYRSPSPVLSGDVSVGCAGRTGQRYCSVARYPRFAGLVIRYKLSQFKLPIPDSASTDPATEPGAVLQFDQRLREWLVKVEHARE